MSSAATASRLRGVLTAALILPDDRFGSAAGPLRFAGDPGLAGAGAPWAFHHSSRTRRARSARRPFGLLRHQL